MSDVLSSQYGTANKDGNLNTQRLESMEPVVIQEVDEEDQRQSSVRVLPVDSKDLASQQIRESDLAPVEVQIAENEL